MLYTADKNQTADSAYHSLVKHIQCKYDIVMVNWCENFVFNDALLGVKDYILISYCEYGWDFSLTETHLWGINSEKFPRYYNGDWIKFDNWVKENPPRLTFKRELLKKDVTDKIKPIDYVAPNIEPIPIQSEEKFNNRPLSCCYYFGRSHEGRLLLHSNIWKGATQYGYSVCDNLFYYNDFMHNERGKKYVSMNIPHYSRQPIQTVLAINGDAKIGVVPFGAGQKTFRAAEVSANSAMLMWEDDLAWASDWVHGVNCIKCKQGEEVETIEKWTQDERLYSIYCEGVKNWEKYRVGNYINNYLLPLINKA